MAIDGVSRIDHPANTGRLTVASSLKGTLVSSVK